MSVGSRSEAVKNKKQKQKKAAGGSFPSAPAQPWPQPSPGPGPGGSSSPYCCWAGGTAQFLVLGIPSLQSQKVVKEAENK